MMTGSLTTLGIVTLSLVVGTLPSAQLPGTAQSVETQPVQVSAVVEAVNGEFSTTGLLP